MHKVRERVVLLNYGGGRALQRANNGANQQSEPWGCAIPQPTAPRGPVGTALSSLLLKEPSPIPASSQRARKGRLLLPPPPPAAHTWLNFLSSATRTSRW